MDYNTEAGFKEPERLSYLKATLRYLFPESTNSAKMFFINAYDAWKIENNPSPVYPQDFRDAIILLNSNGVHKYSHLEWSIYEQATDEQLIKIREDYDRFSKLLTLFDNYGAPYRKKKH